MVKAWRRFGEKDRRHSRDAWLERSSGKGDGIECIGPSVSAHGALALTQCRQIAVEEFSLNQKAQCPSLRSGVLPCHSAVLFAPFISPFRRLC